MPRLPLPKESDDPLRLADFLEIYALLSPDANSSGGDLERAIRRPGLDATSDVDAICADVFSELELRSVAAPRAYPFKLEGGVVSLEEPWENFTPYVFCLCLSYFGWSQRKGERLFPRRMFEDLSALAAKNFLSGDSYRFAAPRPDVPRFRQALEKLCERMGEGNGCKQEESRSAQDDNLDIVAWKHFPDKKEGKLLMFGQCATGEDWQHEKLTSLQPDPFCTYWLSQRPPVLPIRAFFIPHRVDGREWYKVNLHGGIVFDRCRIAHWVTSGKPLKQPQPYIEWIRHMLESQN